jgi:putative endonuclease
MWQWLLRCADAARHRARRKLWTADQTTGRRGEDLAHRFLERQGMTVVARNHRPPSGNGEIDLIAWDGDTLVFVEVKTRRSDEAGVPGRNVDRDKETALVRAGRHYARQAGIPWERVRFDLVSVVLAERPALAHRKDAIRAPGGYNSRS